MSLRSCIDSLFHLNSNYLHAEQAFNQASSLQTLSNDLYTDPFRFVYELIQNADDAFSTQIEIALIENNYLIISHNGRVFNEKDVRSLCSIYNSTKTRDKKTAGYKGLGFKAIFGKSNYVLIVTNGEGFRFDETYEFPWTWKDIDRQTWEDNNERKFIYPWQICPIWTNHEQIPKSIREKITNKDKINIIIRLHNVNETQHALEELFLQPHIFLFLQHIREVKFSSLLQISIIHIKEESDGSIRLSYNINQSSQWLVSRLSVAVPPERLQDIRLPEKLRSVKSTEIGLAAKIDSNKEKTFIPVSNHDSVLFSYMPTKISTYHLPLLINANFLTNANREQIHTDSIWNQWLFECIPRETIEWVKELIGDPKWDNTAYEFLPIEAEGKDMLANKYNESRGLALKNTKFIRNSSGEDLTLNGAVIDLTGLSNKVCIDSEPIRQYIIDQHNLQSAYFPRRLFIPDNLRLR